MRCKSNILSYIQLRIAIEQFQKVRIRFRKNNLSKGFLSDSINELSENIDLILLSENDDAEAIYNLGKTFDYRGRYREEFSSQLSDIKHQLTPGDYLFMKALLARTEQETLFLLQQAALINPENLRYQILNLNVSDVEEFPMEESIRLKDLAKLSQHEELQDYIFLINLLYCYDNEQDSSS